MFCGCFVTVSTLYCTFWSILKKNEQNIDQIVDIANISWLDGL